MWATTLGSLRLRSRTIASALAAGLLVPLLVAPPAQAQGTVTVTVTGQGSATGTGISCTQYGGPDCSEYYPDDVYQECDPELKPPCYSVEIPPDVELTAGADTNGYVFDGWTGCDYVSARVCGLTVTADTALRADFRDAQPPDLSSLSPASGVQRGTMTLAANAVDNSGAVSRVEFRVRGALVAIDTVAPFTASFNTASVSDGAATVRADAFDFTGNMSSVQSSITIDNTAPTVSVTSGPDGGIFKPTDNQTWTFTAADATSGVAALHCSVVPAGSPHSFGSCTGSGSHTVDFRPDGTYEFAVRARDNGGLTTTATRQFTFDGTPPALEVTSGPADGSIQPAGPHTWEFSASDAEGVTAVGCLVAPQDDPVQVEPCSDSYTVGSLSSGAWTFTLWARDAAGNQTVIERDFTVDATAPALAVTDGPTEGSIQPAGAKTWTLSTSDAHGTPTLTCGIAPQGTAPEMGPCTTTTSHTSPALDGGSWTLEVRAVDGVGNTTTATRTFTVDTERPTVTKVGPTAGARTRDRTPLVRATVKDQVLPGVGGTIEASDITLRVDGVRRTFTFASPKLTWQARRLSYGRHVVKLVAVDEVGNRTTKKWWFKVVR